MRNRRERRERRQQRDLLVLGLLLMSAAAVLLVLAGQDGLGFILLALVVFAVLSQRGQKDGEDELHGRWE